MGAAIAARAVLTPPLGGVSWAHSAGVNLAVLAATEAARQLREWVPGIAVPQRTLVSQALLVACDYGEPVPVEITRQLNLAAGDEGAQPRQSGSPRKGAPVQLQGYEPMRPEAGRYSN